VQAQWQDRRESLRGPLLRSLAAHVVLGSLLLFSGLMKADSWGSPHASSGAVGVGLVQTIPIPRNEGKTNPLANDTQNLAPQEAVQPAKKAVQKTPDANALAVPDRFDKKKPAARTARPETYRPMTYQPNQVYTKTAQAASTPMYGMAGSGGIDIGPASVLGARFGAYAQLLRDRIAQHWNTADVRATPAQKCAVSFTIARNGTISNVQVTQASGSYLLDTSAKRAILDSNPLPALPPQFDRSEATVELWFQLNK